MLVANYRSSRYCRLGLFQTVSSLVAKTFTTLDIPALQQIREGRQNNFWAISKPNRYSLAKEVPRHMAFSTSVAQEKAAESTVATVSQVSPLLEDTQYYQIRMECLPPPI